MTFKGILLGLCLVIAEPVFAQEFSSLEGTYEISENNDLRTATVSKIVLKRIKGQPQAQVWFYNANGDVDWGACVLKEFSQPGNFQYHHYVAQVKHNQDESVLVLDPYGGGKNTLLVQSYTTYANSDSKHPNLFCNDRLRGSNSSVKP